MIDISSRNWIWIQSSTFFSWTEIEFRETIVSHLNHNSEHNLTRHSHADDITKQQSISNTIPLGFTKDFRSWINYMFIKKSHMQIRSNPCFYLCCRTKWHSYRHHHIFDFYSKMMYHLSFKRILSKLLALETTSIESLSYDWEWQWQIRFLQSRLYCCSYKKSHRHFYYFLCCFNTSHVSLIFVQRP